MNPQTKKSLHQSRTVFWGALIMIVLISAYFVIRDMRTGDEKVFDINGVSVDEVRREPRESLQIPILVYHQIRPYRQSDSATDRLYIMSPQELEEQLAYLLERGYTTYTFEQLEDIFAGGAYAEPAVILSFDDGSRSHYETVFPLLEAYGMKGVFAPFTNALTNSNYMTAEMIREVHEAGHEIASHSVLHPYLTRVDGVTQERELRASKERLESITEEPVQTFVYPFGLHDDALVALTEQVGYRYGRTLDHAYEITANDALLLPGFIVTGDFTQFLTILNEN